MDRSLLVVLCLLLAGCAESAPTDGEEEEGGDVVDRFPDRMSRGGPGGSKYDDVPHKEVLVFESSLQAVGPTDETFDVPVPAGLLRISYRLTSDQALQRDAFWIDLEGCGSHGNSGISGSFYPASSVTVSEALCDDPMAGTRVLRITSGPATYINGKVELHGWEPLAAGNATKG